MIWQPEFTDKTLSRKPGAVHYINVHNPSPFYVTLVNLQVGSQKLGNAMAAPRVSSQIPLPSGVQGKLKFQTVNDYGSVTPVREVNLN